MDDTPVYVIEPVETPLLRRGPPPSDEKLSAWRKARVESARNWYSQLINVGELIEMLQHLPANAKVAVEDDYDYSPVRLERVEQYESDGENIGPLVVL